MQWTDTLQDNEILHVVINEKKMILTLPAWFESWDNDKVSQSQ